jgi:fatty acid/phospholipid biosynthesis enzyme
MKISILIPVNDFDIVELVHCMREGMSEIQEFCEILIGDDGSSEDYRKNYQSVAGKNVRIISAEKNIGSEIVLLRKQRVIFCCL